MMYKSRPSKLAVDKFPDETIIVDFTTGAYFSLRGSACLIWDMCKDGANIDQIFDAFDDVTDEERQQITGYIDQLKESGIIEEVSGEGTNAPGKSAFEKIQLEKYSDMEELIMLDPIHEVDERGWPHKKVVE